MGALVIVLAVDPGNAHSAYVLYDAGKLVHHAKVNNEELLAYLRSQQQNSGPLACADHLAIEHVAMGGMIAGQEVFDTCMWAGRFIEAWRRQFTLVKRKDVKMCLCGNVRAKDSNIRQALIDRFSGGRGKEAAIGRKAAPGPLYGVAADVWAALAVAVTWSDTQHAATPRGTSITEAA